MIRHKFHAVRTERDGFKFHSKKEARFYDELKLAQEAGIVLFFIRQTPFHIPGNIKVVVDFVIFYTDGTVRIVDTKGMKTPQSQRNLKLVSAFYPVEIEEV